MSEELFGEDNNRVVAGMRARFGARQKDMEIEQLRQQQAIDRAQRAQREQELQRQQSQRTSLLLGLAALLVLLFLVYRHRQDKQLTRRLARGVESQTRDLNRKNNELRSAYQLMEERSQTDELTGLRNRRYFYRRLATQAPDATLYLLLDLDHFKRINDTYGHAAGDMVLVETAERLKGVLRRTDSIIRWGGEEFLVVVQAPTDHDSEATATAAASYAERLRIAIASEPFDIGRSAPVQCSVSIGYLACGAGEVLPWTWAVELADRCLYTVKRTRRNAWLGLQLPARPLDETCYARLLEDTGAAVSEQALAVQTSITDTALAWMTVAEHQVPAQASVDCPDAEPAVL